MAKANLLIVEDEPNLLLGIRDILELDGYEVHTARHGLEALEVLKGMGEKLPDLIVSDIMMPRLDGLEFLQEVRKDSRWLMIPFIFLTAKGSKEDVQAGKRLGVDDYLVKPFDADDLLVAVESKLTRHQGIRQVQTTQISDIKRNILTILNHEFRTPLTLVVAYADMLREGDVNDMEEGELLSFLKEINNGADRLRRLIENFIMLVEIETGDVQKTFDWRKHPIDDMSVIIRSVVQQALSAPRNQHQCELEIKEPLPVIVGDSEYMQIILTELIDNAIKFSKEKPQIRVEAFAQDGNLHINIIDWGRGIPSDQAHRIWDKFTQLDRELHEDQGSGSGLTIVKGLVEAHGGQISVQSEPGVRTCFTLVFPPAAHE
ncbi:MAG: hybrid sensor histidine kinase/response regulator [Anaerolineaceae bacterium]|nr:MAG: hybrid sensor histidine kinase/response regulator [Anaerolineaceae bacterium]